MSNDFVMTIEVEDPARGTLNATHTVTTDRMNTYDGPLGRIILHNPYGPDGMFIAPADEFIIMLAQFIQAFRGVQ